MIVNLSKKDINDAVRNYVACQTGLKVTRATVWSAQSADVVVETEPVEVVK